MRNVVRILISLLVVAGLGWFLLHSVDTRLLWDILTTTSWGLLLGAVPIILLSHVLRASRWNVLLSSVAKRPTLGALFNGVMIGYAASTIVPRSGEVLRPFIVSKRSGVDFSLLLASVLVERVVDVLTLLAGVAAVLILKPHAVHAVIPGVSTATIILTFAVPAAILCALLIAIVFTNVGPLIVQHWIGPLHRGAAAWMGNALESIRAGASVISTPRLWMRITLESLAMWALYAAPLYLVLEAMPWSTPMNFSVIDGVLLLVVTAVGVTVAPTPGAMGVYQGFAQVAMVSLYGATPTEGLAFGMVAWVLNYGVAVVVGAICLTIELRSGLTWRQIASRPEADKMS